MEQLDTCEVCGKNTKFMFVCPHCKKSLCIEHRKQENHNCENLVEEKISPSDEENLGLSEVHNFIYDSDNDLPLLEHTENDEEKNINVEEKYDNDLDVVSIQSNEDIKNESKSRRVIKVLAFSILIILTISSILLNGYLYFNIDNSDKKLIESYNVMEERNILMEQKYNELYLEYVELDEEYESYKESYMELEEIYNETKEYDTHIELEQMKQITIPPGTNAVFFYEIPAPGYITVEYYSDVGVFAMVGSTMIENVYYSRNPRGTISSELTFSVPVIPNLNILFENSNKDHSATIFFGIDYFSR